ncbi:serine-enriched protein-like [Uloborus diversus]|uniref:serine-enriched protein-like n=1 Tax=Uloborus diversus TaxID=327109 RepID=UPI002409F2B6|nr:serine-enriched protein-like [Uloborus diversus]
MSSSVGAADEEEEEEGGDCSVFENKTGLAEDLKFLASMPELCDVTFLVGDTREPVCAVKAVLAARSRVFHKILYGAQQQTPARPETSTPKSKRESTRETKLKMFLKRSSEPILNIPFQQIPGPGVGHQTLIVEEFEPDVFRQLIEYIHTGCVTLQARTLLGLMNAADYYGLEELRKACLGFVQACINVDTVCALLASAEKYIQYKCTKSLVQKVLEFVDSHGDAVLGLGSFALLPEHVVRLILSREELRADELSKFQAAAHWSRRFCDAEPGADLRETMASFLECIEFYKIPASTLMREVYPLGVVPDNIIMNALAYQADPSSVDFRKVGSPNRFRRMSLVTLPSQETGPASLLGLPSDSNPPIPEGIKSEVPMTQALDLFRKMKEPLRDIRFRTVSETLAAADPPHLNY